MEYCAYFAFDTSTDLPCLGVLLIDNSDPNCVIFVEHTKAPTPIPTPAPAPAPSPEPPQTHSPHETATTKWPIVLMTLLALGSALLATLTLSSLSGRPPVDPGLQYPGRRRLAHLLRYAGSERDYVHFPHLQQGP
ncbi:hypothetical protein M409DRAFT_51226 [Zasmidium cellare ATCC 36951]|uniref:Uncharacterized protein n=1 Tax=Zasmidium cellare ATCC 36951 TaxID=1080233 RepID=A0A6A6CYV0_ZASCE|nr:uncharacterized protein M409DRAFT_51226 [Zasmidium cellare ATCC 36951]KAF2170989.1 hypothetical protein M409DRAFT_51226 [Zasmidium cellare ATCC 36951]